MLDKVRIDASDLLDSGALARGLGRGSPSIFDRRPQTRHLVDHDVVLPGGVTKDRDHLSRASRARRDKRDVRRPQSFVADGLRLRHTLSSQVVAVVVGMPTELDVAHPSSSAQERQHARAPACAAPQAALRRMLIRPDLPSARERYLRWFGGQTRTPCLMPYLVATGPRGRHQPLPARERTPRRRVGRSSAR